MFEESMSIPAIWASMSSWFTPTVLFLFLNLMIGTIYVTSGLTHKQEQQQQQQQQQQTHLARSPSILQRLKSINLYAPTRISQDPTAATTAAVATFIQTPQTNTHHDSLHQTHEQDQTHELEEQTHEPEEQTHVQEQLYDDEEHTHDEEEAEEGGKSMDEVFSQLQERHVSRSASDTKPTSGEIPVKLARKMKKSASAKSTFAHFEEEDIVEARRPATVREGKGKAAAAAGDDDEVDAKADDFINKFKQELKKILKLRENELVGLLYVVLLKKRCLVVLDDIWSSEAWDNLSRAFPINENGESKMLLTTRNEAVARRVGDGRCFLYEPRPLNEKESWELLERKALRGKDDPDMAELGKKMVEMCVGLPLAIVVLGGILATKHSLNEWRLVHENIISDLKRGKYLGVSKVLALSYHELSNKLKACFLHLCDFPEDIDIPRRKLVMIWMAEGIVSGEVEKGEKMEDVGERYLGELLDRGMVQAEVVGSTGRVKTCRLHNHMRDLCLLKANQDNFLKIVHTHNGNEPVISVASRLTIAKSSRVHRLAIYLGRKTSRHFSWERERTPYLRSLFINTHGYDTRISKKIKSRFGDFKLLKILDLERCCVEGNLPRAMGNLIHLRYLGLNCSHVTSIPSSFGNLRYLQTLILMGSSKIKIPNVICKMGQLRYLYFNVYSSSGKLRLDNLSNLQTVEGFEPESFDVTELTKLTNLRKLQIYLESFQELEGILRSSPVTALNCLRSLKLDWYNPTMEGTHLQILFSACHDLHNLFLGDRMGKLPEYTQFPQNLSKLTLQYSRLEEDPMATLEKLPNLTILRLYRQAFIGTEMVCSSEGFPQLKYLALSGLPCLEEWFVSEHALPNLCELVIGDCSKLRRVPDGLSFIATLRELQIIRMPEEFKDRLQGACDGREELIQTGEDFYKFRHVPYIRIK